MDATHLEPGLPAALAALVVALDRCGALPKQAYVDALQQIWTALPADEGFDAEAFACARLLDYLNGGD